MLTYGGMAFLTGYLNDRFGAKVVLLLGASLAGTAFAISIVAKSPFQLMISFGVMFGVATCFLSQITALCLLVKLPSQVSSTVFGVVGSGPAVGSLILAPSVGKIINIAGWRPAMGFIAGLFLCYFILTCLLLRKSENDSGSSEPTTYVRSLSMMVEWTNLAFLFLSFLLLSLGIYGVLSQEVAYATDQGIPLTKAALALGLISGMAIAVSPFVGWVSDRVPDLRKLGGLILCLGIFGPVLISVANSSLILIFGSIMVGTVYGCYIPIFPPITRNLVGADLFGRAWGLISMGGSLGAALGSWLGGFIYDLTGGYDLLWLVVGLCFFLASLFLLMVNTKPGTAPPKSVYD